MFREYSEEFIDTLSGRLTDYSNSKVDRKFYNSIVYRIQNGAKLSWEDLDKDTLRKLCIEELCIDPVIGALFNVDHRFVLSLRQLYGFNEETIAIEHTKYIAQKIGEELQNEIGERAFKSE